MQVFFAMVGMAANVSPMEQHVSRATVQLAWEHLLYLSIKIMAKIIQETFFAENIKYFPQPLSHVP
jgi:hypothetical protein